jgi:hypothetical protein
MHLAVKREAEEKWGKKKGKTMIYTNPLSG